MGGAATLGRVLAVLPSLGLGGAEAMTAVLLRDLAARGVRFEAVLEPGLRAGFAAMLGPGLAASVSAAPVGWRDADTAAEDGLPSGDAAAATRSLRRQEAVLGARLLADRPDLVLLPLPWPSHGLGVLAAAATAGVPVLAVLHLAPRDPDAEMARAIGLVPPGALHRAGVTWAAVAAPTAARAAAALGLPPGRIAVVPNGVPVPRRDPAAREAARRAKRAELGLPDGAKLMVAAGRLDPKKGVALLPGLARMLDRRLGGATLAVLGEGPARARLEAEGVGALRLRGRVADVDAWLLAADALLLPSRLEGCPLVFLEAAARRCPVVATEAALEAFGEAAFAMAAVAPDDMASALADRAAEVLEAPEGAATRLRVAAAWRHAAAWDEAAMLARYATLLRAAAAG